MTLARFNYISIIISILCSVHFFGLYYRGGEKLSVLIDLIFVVNALIFLYTNSNYKKNGVSTYCKDTLYLYKIYFLYFFVFLLISTISCLYFHDQNIFKTVQSMRTFIYFSIFFMLLKSNVARFKLENLCYILGFIYCAIFLLQLYLHPIAIVPLGRTEEFDRGLLRLRLEGVGFITLTGMLSLNRYLYTKKVKYLFFLVISILFIYLLGFRTLLVTYFVSLLVLIYYYYNSISLALIFKALIVVILYSLYHTGIITDFIDGSLEQTVTQLEDVDDYIRMLTFRFLFEDINVNSFSLLFGNGFPYSESQYGYELLYIGSESNGFIAADLGLIGFSFYFGVITTLIYIAMLITPFFKSFNKDTIYLNSFGFYLVISSFTTAESYRLGMFGVVCIYLYFVVLEAKNGKVKK